MKIFIWERVENATSNYHSGGGVVVVAETLEQAMSMAEEHGVRFGDEYDTAPIALELSDEQEPRVFVFPDAGCC